MLDSGNHENATPPPNLYDDTSPARTRSSDLFRVLQDFLGRNQIEFIGPFQVRLEGTSYNNWRLLVEGETRRSDWNAPTQVGLGLAWPNIPNSPDDISAYEPTGARTGSTSSSSSVGDPMYSCTSMYQLLIGPSCHSPRGECRFRATTRRMM